MPKMTHWNSPEPVDVPAEKAAVYAAQGWVSTDKTPQKVQSAVTRVTLEEPAEAPAKPAPKKAPAKKAAKKAVKTS